jgi:hypothetical protein
MKQFFLFLHLSVQQHPNRLLAHSIQYISSSIKRYSRKIIEKFQLEYFLSSFVVVVVGVGVMPHSEQNKSIIREAIMEPSTTILCNIYISNGEPGPRALGQECLDCICTLHTMPALLYKMFKAIVDKSLCVCCSIVFLRSFHFYVHVGLACMLPQSGVLSSHNRIE